MKENYSIANLLQTKKLIVFIVFCFITFSQIQLKPKVKIQPTLVLERDPSTWLIQSIENEPKLKQKSMFPSGLFSKTSENAYPFATAIINRVDNSDEGIVQAVQYILNYPFIKEILIYNQVLSRPLSLNLFKNLSVQYKDVQIELFETEIPLYDMGKYLACSKASYGKCYIQDDLWFNTYLDSLYTHSFRYSDHLIVNARPVNYLEYSKWRFQNREISLHTGYVDLRYGAFIPQFKVQNFINEKFNLTSLDEATLRFADVYFSIESNQYPYIIYNPLMSNGRDKFKHVDTINNREHIMNHLYKAVSTLESNLKNKNIKDRSRLSELSPPIPDRDVRSTCGDDRCLFITNIDEMPNIFEFNTERVANMSEFEILYNEYYSLPKDFYSKAVDRNLETCWKTNQNPKENDYFGLYMMGDIRAEIVTVFTKNRFKKLNELFKVQIQFIAFGSWEECQTIQLSNSNSFKFRCPNRKIEPFKSIRITFLKDLNEPLELCGLGLDNFIV